LSIWFRKEARSFVRDVLSPAAVRRRGVFDPRYVQSLIERNERGEVDGGAWLWALVNVELWYRLFIDESSTGASHKVEREPVCAA
jgi:asparagine synthase (glutamine-hydrolysing)